MTAPLSNDWRCEDFFEDFYGAEEERSPEAERHLAECAACRAVAGDLRAIASAAPSLAAFDAAPPERLWLALRSDLEKEGLIAGASVAWPARLGCWWDEAFALVPRPALAGAY